MRVAAKTVSLLASDHRISTAFMAGWDRATRDQCMEVARNRDPGSDARRAWVRFARQDHRRMLRSLSRLKGMIK